MTNIKHMDYETLIASASSFATLSHLGQTRSDGSLYITHPIAVMNVLFLVYKHFGKNVPIEMAIAALLHDTIEDTKVTAEDINSSYGLVVTSLVLELTIDKERRSVVGRVLYMINSLVNMTEKALTLKLCDRFHNVTDLLTAKDEKWRTKYRKETKEILDGLENQRPLLPEHKFLVKMIRELISL